MIWVAWRQQRAQLIFLLVLLVAGYAAMLLLRGSMQTDLAGLGGCATESAVSGPCVTRVSSFKDSWYDLLKAAEAFVLVLPVLLGMFCAAPLIAKELEHGTHLLAFTQSVGRTRWMLSKFAVAAVPALVVLLALQQGAVSWVDAAGRLGPLDSGPFEWTTFGSSGVAPVSYLLFCLAFGMTAGALARRSLVAMFTTLVTFVVLRVLLGSAHGMLAGTQRLVSDDPAKSPGSETAAQYVESGYLNAQGQEITVEAAQPQISACGSRGGAPLAGDLTACYRDHGLVKSYLDVVPSSAAASVHWAEAAVFAVLAVLSLPVCRWALHRRP
ncbi:transporter [Amycolatopsis ultiminotia]|uniref:Transporter n=1 Tax=Amycolatopsis ultiminotia TaxID=543629 RepID=A0ABP6V0H4_9PSEU